MVARADLQYEIKKERMRERSSSMSRSGRDIGGIPPIVDPNRRTAAMVSFRVFLESYFPERFGLKWGSHHLIYIARIEQVIREGGCHAVAMPRGDGKTTIVELAPLWAAFIGAHSYIFLIGNSEPKAEEMLDSIKMELQYNELLAADFPEVCYPIRKLEGQASRAKGQLHYGVSTEIKWSPSEIKLPTIPGSKASGATIRVAGLTGNIRGAVKTLADGRRVRPTLALLDDPQTDESAASPAQCEKRYRIIMGSIMGLAGAGRSMAAIMPCTIIRPDDLAHRLLDHKQSPDWTGETTSMVIKFPTNEDLWDKYGEIRAESLERFGNLKLATKYYRKNRKAMDEGSVVAWEERFDRKVEISAIQSAMNIKFRDERAFWAEYQNNPMPEIEADSMMLSVAEIMAKTNGHARRIIPMDATTLVAHIDIQGKALYYLVTAFRADFTGYIVDYGAFPKQKSDYFTLSGIKYGLPQKYPKKGFEGYLYAGLTDLVDQLVGEWKIDGGGVMRPSRIMIDAAWGLSSDTVFQFCRMSKHAPILMPAIGRYVGASSMPFSEYTRHKGEKNGHNWRIPNVTKKRAIRSAHYDTNYWKSFAHSRLNVSLGDSGSVSLFDPRSKRETHRMLAEQLTAETRFETEGRGRKVDEWKHVKKTQDNHLFDCFVGTLVSASMEGVTLPEIQSVRSRRGRGRKKLSEIQARKRGAA